MNVVPIVINNIGLNCENTLNPWTIFILLDNPDIISPEANVKLNKKAVNIYFIILFMSWNSPLLIIKPIISIKIPTAMQMFAEISWFKFHVGFR